MPKLVQAAVLALALAAAFPAAAQEATVPTLSLASQGSVTATPDTAIVTVGVISQSKTAGPALTENNARMRKLIEEIRAAGVADNDVGTSGFQIEPVVVYPPGREDGTQDPPRVTGYRVDNRVTVKIRDITQTGELLDRVVRIGANQVQGIVFTVEDDEALLNDARAEAMRAVEAKARVYAELGDFRLGRVLLISEGVTRPVFPATMRMDTMAESVPIVPGERELTVTVQVNWEILPR
jgi:uncharacterized protein